MDAPIMPLLDFKAWAACQSAVASPAATARRIDTMCSVDDATYFSINRARKSGLPLRWSDRMASTARRSRTTGPPESGGTDRADVPCRNLSDKEGAVERDIDNHRCTMA